MSVNILITVSIRHVIIVNEFYLNIFKKIK